MKYFSHKITVMTTCPVDQVGLVSLAVSTISLIICIIQIIIKYRTYTLNPSFLDHITRHHEQTTLELDGSDRLRHRRISTE